MLGAAEHSPLTTSVHTHPQPPCSWELCLVAPCLAWAQQVPPHNICVSPLMRFLMMCPCPLDGRWPRQPLARDTSSSKSDGNVTALFNSILWYVCNWSWSWSLMLEIIISIFHNEWLIWTMHWVIDINCTWQRLCNANSCKQLGKSDA